jgi:hypothetical protein
MASVPKRHCALIAGAKQPDALESKRCIPDADISLSGSFALLVGKGDLLYFMQT